MATAKKVTVIPCGAMTADLTWLLLKPGKSITDRNHKDGPAPWVDVPTHCVLVETDEGQVLWDTSCPRDWEERWGPTGLQDFFPYDKVNEDEYLDSRLQPARRRARRDRLRDPLAPALRPRGQRADVQEHQREARVPREGEGVRVQGFEGLFAGAHLKTDYEGLELETVSGDTEFLPGVTLLETPGHTVGTMSMQVDLPDTGTMIFTSDAVYMGESYGPARDARRHRQQPRGLLPLGGEAARHPGAHRRPDGVRARRRADPPAAGGARRSRTRDLPRRREPHRGDDLHLGRAAAEVRRGRARRGRVRTVAVRRAPRPHRHRRGHQRDGRATAPRRQPQALRHRLRDLRRRARRADRRLDEQGG